MARVYEVVVGWNNDAGHRREAILRVESNTRTSARRRALRKAAEAIRKAQPRLRSLPPMWTEVVKYVPPGDR